MLEKGATRNLLFPPSVLLEVKKILVGGKVISKAKDTANPSSHHVMASKS